MQDFFLNNSSVKLEAALYIVATPIGNLRDITLRALEVLQKADYIVCEDSRVTAKLLAHYEIKDKKFIIYNDFGDEKTREKILNFVIQGGVVALVSDAGTPLISDPGYKLVRYVRKYNQKIIPIPGASSTITALCASGLACDNFLFLGFLPTTKSQRINLLKSVPKEYTAIFFESANRINDALIDIDQVFKDRNITVAKELTKIHEEIISAKVKEVINFFAVNSDKLRGEFVIIIEKADKSEKNISESDLIKEIKSAMASGFTVKELSQNLAEIYDLNKKEIYQLALQVKNGN
ncbi:MAG: 16S rRNA (cytidine(1402)-2'-O)-methyltransferase [Rickettsiales bacterium]|nr:16S rRNA (cytidine(1402)-2'-O)-methyltransferase [Rickettsiales bacterium]